MNSTQTLASLANTVKSYVDVIERNLAKSDTFSWYTGYADCNALAIVQGMLLLSVYSVEYSTTEDFVWIISK